MLQTIGGIALGYLATIELQLASNRWTTDIIFTDGLAADSGLLGQLGFFQFFTVTFMYSRSDITIRRARIAQWGNQSFNVAQCVFRDIAAHN